MRKWFKAASLIAVLLLVLSAVAAQMSKPPKREQKCDEMRSEQLWRQYCSAEIFPTQKVLGLARDELSIYVVAVDGSAYLIPRSYLPKAWADGPAREFGIELRLPDFRTFKNGRESATLWGYKDRIRISFHPENLYRHSGDGGLTTEWHMANRIRSIQSQKASYGRYRIAAKDYEEYIKRLVNINTDLNAYWAEYVSQPHPDDTLIDVTHVLGWGDATHHDPKGRDQYFVAFRDGRLVFHMDCNPPGSAPSPGCKATYHLPDRYLYVTFSFGYSHEGEPFYSRALEFGDRIYALLDTFHNEAKRIKSQSQALN